MTAQQILSQAAHRPWPLPTRPWIMRQNWHDLLFAHWPMKPEKLRPWVPSALALDQYRGQAWVAIVPFHMSGVRARALPPLAPGSRFPELNVRTYVTLDDKPGVYFFSLDAGSRLAVWAARRFYHLPYFFARMKVDVRLDQIDYRSRRVAGEAEFEARYRPVRPVQLFSPGTLEYWLTERYCLYAADQGRIYRSQIHHARWLLEQAETEIRSNTVSTAAHLALPATPPPLAHFSKRQDVLIWPLERVR